MAQTTSGTRFTHGYDMQFSEKIHDKDYPVSRVCYVDIKKAFSRVKWSREVI